MRKSAAMQPWNLVHPRLPFFLLLGRPLRFVGFILTSLFFLLLVILVIFGAIWAAGGLGLGPMAPEAGHNNDYWSVVLGFAVAGVFAWLVWRSLKSQLRNWSQNLPVIEGQLEQVTEINESYEDGRGHCLCVKIRGREYLLPPRLKKILKAGRRVKVALWAGSEEVRAVWVAWS